MNNEYQTTLWCNVQFRLGLISDNVRLSLAEFKLKMYHYLHRLWYMKQNLLPHLAKTLRCAINFIWNLSAFICLSKLNNKNSVSILFCITSDCGTVTCYTCLSKLSMLIYTLLYYCFHIDYVLLITLYIKTAYLSCYLEFL